jgi:hypothetical protein
MVAKQEPQNQPYFPSLVAGIVGTQFTRSPNYNTPLQVKME